MIENNQEKDVMIDCPECEEGYITKKKKICWNCGFEVDDNHLFD
jgi:ribosomal protein L37E